MNRISRLPLMKNDIHSKQSQFTDLCIYISMSHLFFSSFSQFSVPTGKTNTSYSLTPMNFPLKSELNLDNIKSSKKALPFTILLFHYLAKNHCPNNNKSNKKK